MADWNITGSEEPEYVPGSGLSITSHALSDPEKNEQRSEYSTIMVPNREVQRVTASCPMPQNWKTGKVASLIVGVRAASVRHSDNQSQEATSFLVGLQSAQPLHLISIFHSIGPHSPYQEYQSTQILPLKTMVSHLVPQSFITGSALPLPHPSLFLNSCKKSQGGGKVNILTSGCGDC